jgi:hypothetical protein
MKIEVKHAIAFDGTSGYVEQHPLTETDRRVFVAQDGKHALEAHTHCYYAEWLEWGKRARHYNNTRTLADFTLA